MFFANADAIAAEIRRAAQRADVHAIVIDAETMPFIDVTAAQVLDRMARELRADGVRLVIARNVGQVRDVLGAALGDSLLDAAYPTVDEAVTRIIEEH